MHEFYHDDVIVEFPQSGELISGKHNIYELWKHYPANQNLRHRSFHYRACCKDILRWNVLPVSMISSDIKEENEKEQQDNSVGVI